MAGARGVIETEVMGKTRRLRIGLKAIDRIETATDETFPNIAESLGVESEVRFGHLYHLYRELCRAGGTPLTEEEEDELLPSDLPEILPAVRLALIEANVIEVVDEEEAHAAEAMANGGSGKKKSPSSHGESGNGSPSDT